MKGDILSNAIVNINTIDIDINANKTKINSEPFPASNMDKKYSKINKEEESNSSLFDEQGTKGHVIFS